jgi:2-(1,2-epoxy-1,2-dihydrophenyl)acetyl-CoA isomerase
MADKFEDIIYAKDDGVAVITLNRPQSMNSFGLKMLSELLAAITDAKSDREVRVVVLTGAGRGFCSGADVKSFTTSDYQEGLLNAVRQMALAVESFEKPYVAAVNGAAVGGGCDIATMADIRIASEKAKFAVNHVRIAGVSIDGGYYFLNRVLGMAKTMELVLTRRFFNAREALAMGYVNQVVPHDDLMPVTMELAKDMAKASQPAIQAAKRLVRRATVQTLDEQIKEVQAAQRELWRTADPLEGTSAVIQRRPASFVRE